MDTDRDYRTDSYHRRGTVGLALIVDLSGEVDDSTVMLHRLADPGAIWLGEHHFKDELPEMKFNSRKAETHKIVLGTVGDLRGKRAKIHSFLNPSGNVGDLSMQWEIIDCSGSHLAKITEYTVGRSSHMVVLKPDEEAYHIRTEVFYQ